MGAHTHIYIYIWICTEILILVFIVVTYIASNDYYRYYYRVLEIASAPIDPTKGSSPWEAGHGLSILYILLICWGLAWTGWTGWIGTSDIPKLQYFMIFHGFWMNLDEFGHFWTLLLDLSSRDAPSTAQVARLSEDADTFGERPGWRQCEARLGKLDESCFNGKLRILKCRYCTI